MYIKQSETAIADYISQFQMTDFLNEELLSRLQLFSFPAYANIYIEADEQHFLYFLVEGQVQCSHYHANGKLAVIAFVEPFTAIGDLEILDEERVNSNVISVQPTILLGLTRAEVHQFGANDPRFLRFLIKQLSAKLYKTDTIHKHQILPVSHRLAAYILAQTTSAEPNRACLPPKDELASLLGTTPRHLNRVLKELGEANLIRAEYPTIHILDRGGLCAINN